MRRGGKRQPPTQTTNPPKITAHHSNQKNHSSDGAGTPCEHRCACSRPPRYAKGRESSATNSNNKPPKITAHHSNQKNHSSDGAGTPCEHRCACSRPPRYAKGRESSATNSNNQHPKNHSPSFKSKKITVQTARAPPASIAALARVPLAMRRGGKRQPPTQTTNPPKITAHHSNQKNHSSDGAGTPCEHRCACSRPPRYAKGRESSATNSNNQHPKNHSPSFKSKKSQFRRRGHPLRASLRLLASPSLCEGEGIVSHQLKQPTPQKSQPIIQIKKITVQTARAPPASIAALARVPLAMRRGGKRQPPTQTTSKSFPILRTLVHPQPSLID